MKIQSCIALWRKKYSRYRQYAEELCILLEVSITQGIKIEHSEENRDVNLDLHDYALLHFQEGICISLLMN